jgi:3-phosphoshikimate 1-carboxyvinyltransferase
MSRVEISSAGSLRGVIRVPGDKSISHRTFLMAALAEGTSTASGFSLGGDVVNTRRAMESMGADIVDQADGSVRITGGRSRLHEPESVIDVGNAGTGMRLLAGWSAAMPWLTVIAGDESLHKRDMARVTTPLREMGARIDGRSDGKLPPLVIRGGNLRGIRYESLAGTAQSKSAVMLAGLSAASETVVHESVPARAHTEEMLAAYGADINTVDHPDGSCTTTLAPSGLKPFTIDVPGDPSQSAFWIVAGTITEGSDITVKNVYVGPMRAGYIDVLERMGADIELQHIDSNTADVRVRYSNLKGTEIGGDEIPSLIDELPILVLAASRASGTTVITDAAELRAKESDRITLVAQQIGGLGANISERADGFIVEGSSAPLQGGTVEPHLDHRIAMTAAIAAQVSTSPVVIGGWECVETSYPGFMDDLATLQGGSL